MLCYVMLCYVMLLCYVLLCYVMYVCKCIYIYIHTIHIWFVMAPIILSSMSQCTRLILLSPTILIRHCCGLGSWQGKLFYQRGLPWDEPVVKESSNSKSKKTSKADRGETPKASRTNADTTRDFLLITEVVHSRTKWIGGLRAGCIPRIRACTWWWFPNHRFCVAVSWKASPAPFFARQYRLEGAAASPPNSCILFLLFFLENSVDLCCLAGDGSRLLELKPKRRCWHCCRLMCVRMNCQHNLLLWRTVWFPREGLKVR